MLVCLTINTHFCKLAGTESFCVMAKMIQFTSSHARAGYELETQIMKSLPLWWPQQGQHPCMAIKTVRVPSSIDAVYIYFSRTRCCLAILVYFSESLCWIHSYNYILNDYSNALGYCVAKNTAKHFHLSCYHILHNNSMQHVRLGVIPAMLIQPQFLCCISEGCESHSVGSDVPANGPCSVAQVHATMSYIHLVCRLF